ncbi:MAG: hypothetical protein KF729_05030 [Sandaracinaceae bacterium]|nr:hypothetical protein [Sandaracinaceae bacterium]
MFRRLLALWLWVGLLAPAVVRAQAADDGEAPTEREAATEREDGYEPDQRGAQERPPQDGADQAAGGETGYEPDQRGVEEEDEEALAEPASGTAQEADRLTLAQTSAADPAARTGFGLDLLLFGGLGADGFEVFGGRNVVRATQGGSVGGSFGASLGLGIGPFSVGPRVSFTFAEPYALGALGIDAHLRLSNGWIAPTLRFSFSYAFLFGLADPLPEQNTPEGMWAELGLGVRVRISDTPIILGAELSGGWLALFRDAVPACTTSCTEPGLNLREGGTTNGATFRLQLFGGVSF